LDKFYDFSLGHSFSYLYKMRGLFILSLLLLGIYELATTWLVMPLPGSQELDSVVWAYWLHTSRWWIRAVLLVLMLMSLKEAFAARRKWIPVVLLVICGGIIYITNFILSAESMFSPPKQLIMNTGADTVLEPEAIIIGVAGKTEAKAYPIRYIAYHHQVYDSIDGQPMLVTYCSVCRSGRVFSGLINGKSEGHLRLVGMTHYNAMFEDAATGSWWMQATGEAVTGPMRGQRLQEIPSHQMRLDKWKQLYPHTLIMQPDPASVTHYDTLGRFERGESKGDLTRYDPGSWNSKSWVVGVIANGRERAYDWNQLLKYNVINDTLGQLNVAVLLSADKSSIAAFIRPGTGLLSVQGDTLYVDSLAYTFSGKAVDKLNPPLTPLPAYQEHWHSWKQFHGADTYQDRANN
jgi:Protein of unknown function (DUF3179)